MATMSGQPGGPENAASPSRAKTGVIALVMLFATLAGVWLWLVMLTGPLQLAGGLLGAGDHLDKAQAAIAEGKLKRARLETLAAVAGSERARAGLDSHSPAADVLSYVGMFADALGEAEHLVGAAEEAAAALAGTYDVAANSLKGRDKVVARDPEDPAGGSLIRLDRIEEIGRTITRVRDHLAASAGELRKVDVLALPSRARPAVATGIARAEEADELLADAEAGFEILPGFLGADGPRRYLLGMQNSAELRGTGGAMLRFARITLDRGRFRLDSSSSVYKIDENREPISIPLPDDAWYVAGIPDAQRFGNSNWSPDWPLTSNLTLSYGRASKPSFQTFDGVIGVDPIAMELLLPGAGGYSLGANERGLRINATKVVHYVLNKAYATKPNAGRRRAVLQDIVEGFYRSLLKPSKPSELAGGMGESLGSKHMQVWLRAGREQAFIRRMNWDGSIQRAKNNDYLYIVEQNVGGNKLNYFEEMKSSMDVTLSQSAAEVTTRVHVANDVFLPQPRYVLGAIKPVGYHRPMLNVYVPGNAELIDAAWKGERVDTSPTTELATWQGGIPPTHEERDKRVWSATLLLAPGKDGEVRYDYRVPGVVRTVGDRKLYRLVLQRQPKVRPEEMSVRITPPPGAGEVRAPGFRRDGDAYVWSKPLRKDIVLEVSWQA